MTNNLGNLIGLGIGLAITERILKKRKKKKLNSYIDKETKI